MIFRFVCAMSYFNAGRILFTITIIVRHIPEWLPWLSYKPLARLGYNLGQETMYEPIRFVKETMVRGCFGCLHLSIVFLFSSLMAQRSRHSLSKIYKRQRN
jgi:hypothetical protein